MPGFRPRIARLHQVRFRDKALAVDRAAAYLQAHPLAQIAYACVDATRAADVVHVAPCARPHFSFGQLVHGAVVRNRLRLHRAKVRALHSKRIENTALNECLPPTTRRGRNRFAGSGKHDVLVLIRRTERLGQRNETDHTDNFFTALWRAYPQNIVAA